MAKAKANSPKYVSLKDLIPSFPDGTPTLPYPGNIKTRYVKVKRPLFTKDGVKIHWLEVRFREEEEDHLQEHNCVLGYLMNVIVSTVKSILS
ncbi:hypothetical protein ACOSQ3_011429 [Xanthoceras sorbifolium]